MTYYHVLWTSPQWAPGSDPSAQELFLWDFEFLTWFLSLLQAGRFGKVALIADSRGALAAERAGLSGFYQGGISTALDAVPANLNHRVFWAGGKLYAYAQAKTPCVFLDLDAVLWRPIATSSKIMALHHEGRDWIWYKNNQQDFAQFGFAGDRWDWNLDPFNMGVLFLGDAAAAKQYARTACDFVELYSDELRKDPLRKPNGSEVMLFAEQRLLPMSAAQFGISVKPITAMPRQATCLPANPDCLHLWRAKLAYKLCPDARVAVVNWLINLLLTEFPESKSVLARWNFDRPQVRTEDQVPGPEVFEEVHRADLRFSLINNVDGVISIEDSTTGITRKAAHGCMVWSGEVIRPEPGARFDLEVMGLHPLAIRVPALKS